MVCLATLAAVGGVTGVPDARITVDAVEAGSSDPITGERVGVNVTVANSGGSPDAANVTAIRLIDANGEVRDVATAPGALSPGDSLDTRLWTAFDEPGEHRLTVEVVAREPNDDEETPAPTVTVRRDVFVDVSPSETAVNLRVRPLSPADLQSEEDDGGDVGGVGGVGGIEGILGGGGGGLRANEEETPAASSADSPVAVTVVNTGTTAADRVSLTASLDGVESVDGQSGPFVVEDVGPGEERRVVVDLGPLADPANVTFTARYRSDAGSPNGAGAAQETTARLSYPPRDGRPTITEADVSLTENGRVVVDANLGNAGESAVGGVVVSVADAPGVTPTPTGEAYFVGSVEANDFAPFELRTTANATAADEIPIRIEYTDRGVRYTETVRLDAPEPSGTDDDDAGTAAAAVVVPGLGRIAAGAGLVAVLSLAAVGVVARRRHV